MVHHYVPTHMNTGIFFFFQLIIPFIFLSSSGRVRNLDIDGLHKIHKANMGAFKLNCLWHPPFIYLIRRPKPIWKNFLLIYYVIIK